jgi:PAS domain S-box-containing protein
MTSPGSNEDVYRSLFDSMDAAFTLGEAVRDAAGRVVDYRFLAINQAMEQLLGLRRAEVVGKMRSELMPADPEMLQMLAAVVDNGQTMRTERHSPLLDRWLSLAIFPQGQDRFATWSQDTTEQRRAALQRAAARTALHKSEQRMRLAIRATRMVTWEWLPESDLITTSDNFAELYGLPALSGADAGFALVLEEDKGAHLAKVRRIAIAGGTYDSEFRIRRPSDGQLVWLEERAEAQVNDRGTVERVIGVTLDISERKRTEQALRESEELHTFLLKLSDALRAQSDASTVKDEAARITGEYLRSAWTYYAEGDWPLTQLTVEGCHARAGVPSLDGVYPIASFGFRAQLEAGRPVAVPDFYADPRLARDSRARFGQLGMRSFAAAPIVKDGSLRAVMIVADTRQRNWSEHELRLLLEVVERTWASLERARAEAALRASEASLKLADRAKDEFLAVLGHELRTPLAAITLWGGLLRTASSLPAELSPAVQAILQSATAQSRVVDDLLDLSRLVTGKLQLTPESFDIEGVARAILDLVRPGARAKQLTLAFEATPGLGQAFLDLGRLRQVLLNLLSNAIQFTPEGGTVTLRLRADDDFVEAEVADNGEGIAPEFVAHLFERFRQADMGETRRHGGLGIGLALSRQLVELQGGTISAHSDGVGSGATFRVRLPRGRATDRGHDGVLARAGMASVAEPLQGATVLLVEDDASTLAAMETTLAGAGATVHAVQSGTAALEVLESNDIPGRLMVLVSDLGLAQMSGYELVQRVGVLRQADGRPPIAACAVSAHASETDRHRAVEAGFDIYVTKPITPEQLVEAVSDLLQIARDAAEVVA